MCGEDNDRSHPMGLQGNRNKTATTEHHKRDLERWQRRNGEAAARNITLQRNIRNKVSSGQMDKNDFRTQKKEGKHTS
jgi:hypothetical protein